AGSDGTITFSIFDRTPMILEAKGTRTEIAFDPLPHVQQPMIDAVVRYFRGEGPNPCPLAEAIETMEWMDAFTQRRKSA
ncbi:MAG: Gfo/Idh/MocA family oxidoreductase, partial [Flaviaesturariibacter sp.]|nr:Gfo/Idh/MocA family oxidoreductase [Flaviaesturariibacter sp.]